MSKSRLTQFTILRDPAAPGDSEAGAGCSVV